MDKSRLNISKILFGDSEFSTQDRIFNIVLFVSVLFSLLSIWVNVSMSFPIFINISVALCSIMLMVIYFVSRLFKRKLLWLYIITILLILSLTWIFSEGPEGAVNYIYIVAFILFLSITHGKQHIIVSALLMLNIAILLGISHWNSDLIYPYVSEQIKINDLIITFLMVIVGAGYIYSSLRKGYEREKGKVEIQKLQIERQHKHITDSLFYAEEIQSAFIQDSQELQKYFSEYFMVWFPKDIISGDFYFYRDLPDNPHKVLVVVADCTGHGVPGALLTMLGISLLKEIVQQTNNLSSNEILNILRDKVIDSLIYNNRDNESSDGMEMSLCIIDKQEKTIDFAGANRPLLIVNNGNLKEYKPNRFPIGVPINNIKPFTNQIIPIHKDDMVYMFTDGYPDQFGEKDSRKFFVSNFKKMLIKHSSAKLEDQGKIFNIKFLDWKGVKEQIDDVLVLGFRPLS